MKELYDIITALEGLDDFKRLEATVGAWTFSITEWEKEKAFIIKRHEAVEVVDDIPFH